MIVALLGVNINASTEHFHYLLMSDLVCFVDKLIKSTDENEPCDDFDSSSFSTELSEMEAEEILDRDG